MGKWTWAAASCRGTSHVQGNLRCQDAMACSASGAHRSRFIAILCDGAGSAAMGGEGATLAARVISVRARAHALKSASSPTDETIHEWIDHARDVIEHTAQKRQLRSRDFAATLVCALSDGTDTTVIHIGDGCVVGQDANDYAWYALTWPAHGEYASTTFFITDDVQPRVVITRHQRRLSALVAFTDGLERLALDFASNQPHDPFFNGIVRPLAGITSVGRDRGLSEKLARYLDSASVNHRTDDDKSLIMAVCR